MKVDSLHTIARSRLTGPNPSEHKAEDMPNVTKTTGELCA